MTPAPGVESGDRLDRAAPRYAVSEPGRSRVARCRRRRQLALPGRRWAWSHCASAASDASPPAAAALRAHGHRRRADGISIAWACSRASTCVCKPGVDASAFRDRLQARLPAGSPWMRGRRTPSPPRRACRAPIASTWTCSPWWRCSPAGSLVFSTQVLVGGAAPPLFRAAARARHDATKARALCSSPKARCSARSAAVWALPAGFLLASVAVRIIGPDLGSGYFRWHRPDARRSFPPRWRSASRSGSRSRCSAGSLPALEAARAAPALALRAGDEERALSRALRPIGPGLTLLALAPRSPRSRRRWPACRCSATRRSRCCCSARCCCCRGSWGSLLALLPTPRRAAPQLALAQLRGAPGAGRGDPCRHRRQPESHGRDGDHGGVFPPGARCVAHRHLAGRPLRARQRERRQRLHDRGRPGAYRAPCPASLRAEFLREQQLVLDPARPRVVLLARTIDAADPERRLAAGEPGADAGGGRAAADVGQRDHGRRVRFHPRQGGRHSARRQIGALHRRRRMARLRAPAGRDGDRARALCRADRR